MWKRIINARVVSILSFASCTLIAGGWLWGQLVLGDITETPLILHFNDLSGITSVGSFGIITFMSVLGIAIVVMNFFIALELEARDKILGKLAAVITFAFALLLFIAFAAIINVN